MNRGLRWRPGGRGSCGASHRKATVLRGGTQIRQLLRTPLFASQNQGRLCPSEARSWAWAARTGRSRGEHLALVRSCGRRAPAGRRRQREPHSGLRAARRGAQLEGTPCWHEDAVCPGVRARGDSGQPRARLSPGGPGAEREVLRYACGVTGVSAGPRSSPSPAVPPEESGLRWAGGGRGVAGQRGPLPAFAVLVVSGPGLTW